MIKMHIRKMYSSCISLTKVKATYISTLNPYTFHKIYMAMQCTNAYLLEINTHQPVIPSFFKPALIKYVKKKNKHRKQGRALELAHHLNSHAAELMGQPRGAITAITESVNHSSLQFLLVS